MAYDRRTVIRRMSAEDRDLWEAEQDAKGDDHRDRCVPGCPCASLRPDHAADVKEGLF